MDRPDRQCPELHTCGDIPVGDEHSFVQLRAIIDRKTGEIRRYVLTTLPAPIPPEFGNGAAGKTALRKYRAAIKRSLRGT